jgi:t-SNARE complex subunit (syntaxin)
MAETEDRAPREAEVANPTATEHGLGGVIGDEADENRNRRARLERRESHGEGG